MATEQEGHTPWGVEQTENMLWIGPMRPDGCKVDQVVCGLNYDRDLTVSAKLRQLKIAYLIAAAPDLLEALREILGPLNVCSDNRNVRDDQVLPVDMTMGELRKARAAIARATGEA